MSMLRRLLAATALNTALLMASAAGADGPNLGTPISDADLAPWDLTVMPDGAGLPSGSGTAAQGKPLFATYCAVCHGENGKGGLVEAVVVDHPPPLSGPGSVKAIGNFWPVATTVFDFIRRAMPYTQPTVLTSDQAYALTAYLLNMNGVIDEADIMNAATLPKVRMPNRDDFFRSFPN